ncbi:MAG: hypothetical protein H6858_03530 [Rhodospirillales bacterium]|nr:hypothetical protein [Alphaproteobacteria bacterium]MCB1840429.1 hypothetical protein [Alphaproteobacteria bacterium]MCB9976655.1 hypothetical protein [Rhodospirillales bacterium]
MALTQENCVKAFLTAAVVLNIGLWFSVRTVQAKWVNVPPAPDKRFAAAYGLGDAELSYRAVGIMIQNMGDTGGRSASLSDYNYPELVKWFFLEDSLDPLSNYVPYLAAFYFGGVQHPELFRPVLDYLETVGKRSEGEKWRFLAHAIYLARFEMGDSDKALQLANELATVNNPKMPHWTRQMRAFIMNAQGKKQAAYALLLEMLKTDPKNLAPNESNFLRGYICERILDKAEADLNPICKDIP